MLLLFVSLKDNQQSTQTKLKSITSGSTCLDLWAAIEQWDITDAQSNWNNLNPAVTLYLWAIVIVKWMSL